MSKEAEAGAEEPLSDAERLQVLFLGCPQAGGLWCGGGHEEAFLFG